MRNILFVIGLISSITSMIAINITAINEVVYDKIFIFVIVLSSLAICICYSLYSGKGWLYYSSFLFASMSFYSLYKVFCHYFVW
jgi:hypothetical protein